MTRAKNVRKTKRRVFKSRQRPAKISKSLRRTVRTIVKRSAETKKNQTTPPVLNIWQSIDAGTIYPLIPALAQGTGQADRVGNRVMPFRMTLRMALIVNNLNLQVTLASPTYFDIYIFKSKSMNMAGGSPTALDMNKFLQFDNSTTAYSGLVLDGMRPVNSDMFNLLYKKRIMLANFTNNSTSGTIAGITQSTNPCRMLYVNLSKHVKKTWIYNDTDNTVQNDNMYIAIGATQANGQALTNPVGSYHYFVDVQYKDI